MGAGSAAAQPAICNAGCFALVPSARRCQQSLPPLRCRRFSRDRSARCGGAAVGAWRAVGRPAAAAAGCARNAAAGLLRRLRPPLPHPCSTFSRGRARRRRTPTPRSSSSPRPSPTRRGGSSRRRCRARQQAAAARRRPSRDHGSWRAARPLLACLRERCCKDLHCTGPAAAAPWQCRRCRLAGRFALVARYPFPARRGSGCRGARGLQRCLAGAAIEAVLGGLESGAGAGGVPGRGGQLKSGGNRRRLAGPPTRSPAHAAPPPESRASHASPHSPDQSPPPAPAADPTLALGSARRPGQPTTTQHAWSATDRRSAVGSCHSPCASTSSRNAALARRALLHTGAAAAGSSCRSAGQGPALASWSPLPPPARQIAQ